ncbi:MAG: hypothetical protein IJB97_01325, partial [Clostridia bacterium]|nr:hypothetical protein [Clostridia bacterium]
MKDIKKFLLALCACTATTALALGIAACGGSDNSGDSSPDTGSVPSEPIDLDKLTGFDVPEQAFANYGYAVEIQPPIVIDAYGNVLGVTYEVKDSSGNLAKDFNRGFFATDKNGYTVTYSVTAPSGETKTATTKYTVLNFAEDAGITLIDAKSTVDFTEYVTDETTKTLLNTYADHVAWILKPTYYDASNSSYSFKSNAADLSATPRGVYALTATVGGTEVYRTGVDIFDSTAPFEYADIASQNWSSAERRTGNGLTSSTQWNETIYELATAEELATINATGDFYKMTVEVKDNSYAWGQKVKMRPLTHTKTYYERYADLALAFDWWFEIEGRNSYDFAVYGETATSAYTTKYLRTVTIPMQSLLDEWTDLTDTTANNKWNFKGTPWLLTGNDASVTKPLELYMGNVRTVSMKKETLKTLNVQGDSIDMSDLIADETLKASFKANAENTSWTLTPSFYTTTPSIVEFKGNTVDLTDVLHGVYSVTASDGTTTYQTSVDIYDLTAPFEFTDIAGQDWTVSDHRTANGLVSTTQWNKTTYFSATLEEKTAVGATGDYYKMIVDGDFWKWSQSVKILPQTHTKTYYEQFADKTVAFDWWFDMDGADSFEFTVYGQSTALTYKKNTPNMVTVPMQALLDDWDNFMDTTRNSKDNFKGSFWLRTGSNSAGTNFKLFIGNVRVLNYEEKTDLVNVKSGNVDLSDLITEANLKQMFKANAATTVWKLTKNSVTTVLKGNTHNLENLPRGVYDITAETTGVAYGTKVDLYDPNVFDLYDYSLLATTTTVNMTDKYTSASAEGVYFWQSNNNLMNCLTSVTLSSVTSVGGENSAITAKSGNFVKIETTNKAGSVAYMHIGLALM